MHFLNRDETNLWMINTTNLSFKHIWYTQLLSNGLKRRVFLSSIQSLQCPVIHSTSNAMGPLPCGSPRDRVRSKTWFFLLCNFRDLEKGDGRQAVIETKLYETNIWWLSLRCSMEGDASMTENITGVPDPVGGATQASLKWCFNIIVFCVTEATHAYL